MNRSAFTLIEVLVSVTILAVVATGLFQISINSKNNFSYLAEKANFDRLASIPITHNDIKYHHKDKVLYDFLRDDYLIKDDEVIKYLKKEKVRYDQEEFATFAPFSEEGDIEETFADDENNPSMAGFDLTLQFDKITISNKHQSTYVYKIQKR